MVFATGIWSREIEFVDKGFLNIFDKYRSSCPLGRCCEAAAAGEAASNAPGGNATMAAEAALSAAKAAGASPSQQVLAAAAATAAAAAKASGGDPRKASEDAAAAASQIAKETNLSLAVLSFPSSLLHRERQDQCYVKRHRSSLIVIEFFSSSTISHPLSVTSIRISNQHPAA